MSTDHISGGSGTDTIVLDGCDSVIDFSNLGAAQPVYTIDSTWDTMSSTITLPSSSSYTLGTSGSSYTYTTSSSVSGNYNWNQNSVVNIGTNGIDMAAGTDIKIDGKSLKQFMDKMEERLAILVPDPNKIEKFEALKKAYEHYKLMEKLCQEEPKEGE